MEPNKMEPNKKRIMKFGQFTLIEGEDDEGDEMVDEVTEIAGMAPMGMFYDEIGTETAEGEEPKDDSLDLS